MSSSKSRRTRPWPIFLMLSALFIVGFQNLYFSRLKDRASYSQVGDESADRLRRYALYALLVVFALVSLKKKASNKFSVNGLIGKFALAFVAYSSLSVLWAEDSAYTTKKVLLLLILSSAAFVAARRFSAEDILYLALLYSGSNLLLGFGTEVALGIFRPFEAGYRFSGTLSTTGAGMNCAILLLAALVFARQVTRGRAVFLLLSLVALLFLMLSGARTAFASTIIGVACFVLLVTPVRSKVLLIATVLFCCSLVLLLSFGTPVLTSARHILLLGRPESDLETFTGRLPLWQDCMDFVAKRPLLGYGYNSFWTEDRDADLTARWHWSIGSGHSTYLDVALDLGIFGLFLYLGVLGFSVLQGVRRSWRSKNPTYAFITAMLLLFVFCGTLDSFIITYPGSLQLLPMLAVVHLAFVRREPRAVNRLRTPEAAGGPTLRLRGGSGTSRGKTSS